MTATLADARHEQHGDDRLALCLCGGGYRAMLFHVGCLWRLNELGWLSRVRDVSSVSGGAITAGALAANWDALDFDATGVARSLHETLVGPIRRLADETIDEWCLLGDAFSSSSAAAILADALDRYLFDARTLQDLTEERPGVPRFIFSASNLESGALFSFSRSRVWDWRLGDIGQARVRLAVAVAAGAASVPMLSPLALSFDDPQFKRQGDAARQRAGKSAVLLTDGSVIDPLAIEAVWDSAETLIVCDGGGSVPDALSGAEWFAPTARVIALMHDLARRGQLARLLDARAGRINGNSLSRESVYCGIEPAVGCEYSAGDAESQTQCQPSAAPNRLLAMNEREQERWIDRGYAVCDAATRRLISGSPAAGGGPQLPDAPPDAPDLSEVSGAVRVRMRAKAASACGMP